MTKDSLAFAGFFLIFDLGRRGAKIIATTFDSISFTPGSRPSAAIKELKPKGIIKIDSTRTKTSLILQSFLILIAGGTAGWAHSQFSLPLDKLRQNPSQSIAEVLKPSSPLLRMNPSRLSHLPYQRGPGRTERMGRVISNGIVRGIRLVPIYSIGFLVFAVVGGDLE